MTYCRLTGTVGIVAANGNRSRSSPIEALLVGQ
jgi:hypothetical protein